MAHTTHSGRVVGPVHYLGADGIDESIPLGPCLVEHSDGPSVDIYWGELADQWAPLTQTALDAAEDGGHLVILD